MHGPTGILWANLTPFSLQALGIYAQVRTAFERLGEFFELPHAPPPAPAPVRPLAVTVKGSFFWHGAPEAGGAAAGAAGPQGGGHILKEVDLKVLRGDLVVIVGEVGSGKSSLLSAVLATTGCHVAYVSQEPFIVADTVRGNITFGKFFQKARYENILAACCLVRDLELMPVRAIIIVSLYVENPYR
jgi:ABC-type multidrug transport system fused ATPase/permease subunit